MKSYIMHLIHTHILYIYYLLYKYIFIIYIYFFPVVFSWGGWVVLFLHLWLLKLQVLSVLYWEVNVLQYYVNTFFISAVKREESYYTVVINLDTQTDTVSLKTDKYINKNINLVINMMQYQIKAFTYETTNSFG